LQREFPPEEAGMFGREAKPEWQSFLVIASFKDDF
jgi:hypothetical protein